MSPAQLERLIFRVIPDENARRQELQAGTIDGYDLPSPADWDALEADGNQVLVRPPFNVLYLGINQKNNPALQDVRVRQAIAYALDRESLVRNQLPEGAHGRHAVHARHRGGLRRRHRSHPVRPGAGAGSCWPRPGSRT